MLVNGLWGDLTIFASVQFLLLRLKKTKASAKMIFVVILVLILTEQFKSGNQ